MVIGTAPAMLVFDWDGTLCDSLERIVYCLQLAAEDSNLPVPLKDQTRDIVGLGLREAFEQLFPGTDAAEITVLRENYAKHFRREDAEPSRLYPGVPETLEELRDQGFIMAVGTGKSRAGLDRVLASTGMNGFFHSTRCADETASKPDPLMLNSLLGEHALSAGQAIMVGDTTFDMEMAQRSGMPRVAVSYGAHDLHRLLPYQPLACLDRFDDIFKIL